MGSETHHRDDVFGMAREIPKNYLEREHVDDRLLEDLNRGRHVVIYGASKQGKTCLRKHCLDEDDYISVQCSNKWELPQIHEEILKQAGYEITLSEKKTASKRQKIKARIGSAIPGVNVDVAGEDVRTEKTEEITTELDLDPESVNDIIKALNKINFDKYIVLEDFHYLSRQAQIDVAIALKAFHEDSPFKIIVVGVWLEKNRLIVLNGDLAGRVIARSADDWEHNQLMEVIKRGEELLNVELDTEFKNDLVQNCYESVYIVQEACRVACRQKGIEETQQSVSKVGQSIDARKMIESVVNDQSGRYESFITNFSDGFQKTELEMYKWLLYPIITSETSELEDGLLYHEMREEIESEHPEGEDLNPGNLTQALQSVGSLQSKLDIKPFVLSYNQSNNRITIVDRGFLIWLDNQDQDRLLQKVGLPIK